MEKPHFIKTLCKHKVQTFFWSTLITLNVKWLPRFTINDVTVIESCQFKLSSLEKLSSSLNKNQLRETRKYLELFYIQQPNRPHLINVTEGGKEGEVMHVYGDHRSHSYQRPTRTSDQQKTWHWWHKKEFTHMNIWTPLNESKNHSNHPKTTSIAN